MYSNIISRVITLNKVGRDRLIVYNLYNTLSYNIERNCGINIFRRAFFDVGCIICHNL